MYPLQSPAACILHKHHWSSNYHHIQSSTLLQRTPPLFPLFHLILQLDEHLHSNYKILGQLYTVIMVEILIIIFFYVGGSKVPVVTVNAPQHSTLIGGLVLRCSIHALGLGHMYLFDVTTATTDRKYLKGSCHSIQEVPSCMHKHVGWLFLQVSELFV